MTSSSSGVQEGHQYDCYVDFMIMQLYMVRNVGEDERDQNAEMNVWSKYRKQLGENNFLKSSLNTYYSVFHLHLRAIIVCNFQRLFVYSARARKSSSMNFETFDIFIYCIKQSFSRFSYTYIYIYIYYCYSEYSHLLHHRKMCYRRLCYKIGKKYVIGPLNS